MSPTIPVPTALGRVIDLKYPSNRWAVLGSLGAAAASKVAGRSWAGSARVGLSGFAAWSLARELDPDASRTANVALPIAALATFQAGEGAGELDELAALLPAFATLAGLRLATASTGDAPRWYDHLAVTGVSALTGQSGNHAMALLPALSALASMLARDGREPPAWLAPLAAAAGLMPRGPEEPDLTNHRQGVSGGLAGLALALSPLLTPREQVDSEMDNGEGKISPQRLQAARLLGVLGVGLGLTGDHARAGIPLAAATAVIASRRVLWG